MKHPNSEQPQKTPYKSLVIIKTNQANLSLSVETLDMPDFLNIRVRWFAIYL